MIDSSSVIRVIIALFLCETAVQSAYQARGKFMKINQCRIGCRVDHWNNMGGMVRPTRSRTN